MFEFILKVLIIANSTDTAIWDILWNSKDNISQLILIAGIGKTNEILKRSFGIIFFAKSETGKKHIVIQKGWK